MKKIVKYCSLILLILSTIYLINYEHDSRGNKKIENELSRIHELEIKKNDAEKEEETQEKKEPTLEEINTDYVGWLRSEIVNLPVVLENGNDYLNYDFYKKRSVYGTAFIQDGNLLDDKNIVIYGHNMSDGQMFTPLLQLEEKSQFQQANKIQFLDHEWEVICAGRTMIDEAPFYNQTQFFDDEEFQEFLENIVEKSNQKKEVQIINVEQVLTLSTCTRDNENERFYVMAIR